MRKMGNKTCTSPARDADTAVLRNSNVDREKNRKHPKVFRVDKLSGKTLSSKV